MRRSTKQLSDRFSLIRLLQVFDRQVGVWAVTLKALTYFCAKEKDDMYNCMEDF